jgi:ComF family protein
MFHTLQNAVRQTADAFMPSMLAADIEAAEAEPWAADAADAYCPRCGATAGPGSVMPTGCPFCRQKRLPWQRVTRLGPYREPLSDWLKALKFAGHWPWGPWLGRQLAEALTPAFDETRVVVCPVPMHWIRRCQRGYNQAHLIARTIARQKGWPLAPILKRPRYTTPQPALSPTQRQANVRQAFTIEPVDLTGWQIILVDDIKTTGSTLAQCARLLQNHGARSVEIAVAAVADPKGQDFQTI